MEDNFSMDGVGGWRGGGQGTEVELLSGSNVSEALFACWPLTSCCGACFLTGHVPLVSVQPGGWRFLSYSAKEHLAEDKVFFWDGYKSHDDNVLRLL